jgi:uncharacterized protein (TIGR03437 family)
MQRCPFPTAVLALFFPAAALADNSATLNAGQSISFDTCAVVPSGDATFTGSSLTFATGVLAYNWGVNAGGSSFYSSLNGGELSAVQHAGSNTPISLSSLGVNDVFSVLTKGGNVANALVIASSSTSLSIRYGTFLPGQSTPVAGCTGVSGPTITGIYNSSSLTPPGFPNSGISPSSLFVIKGANLADPNAPVVNQDSTKGLPVNGLNGATVSIDAGGKTFTPALYHALASEIAGVLPAAVPTGTATFTVTYNGQSSQAQVQVVASAYGFDTYEGFAVATDAVTGQLVTYTNSAKPGQTLIFWGTGNGADPSDSDTTYSSSPHQISTPVQFYIGSTQLPAANVAFQGNSVYPGVQIYGITLPNDVMTGCFVPIAAVTNGVPSAPATLPIAAAGGVCQDAYTGFNGSQLMSLLGQTTANSGMIAVGQATIQGAITDLASATFQRSSVSSNIGTIVAPGACALTQNASANSGSTVVGLNPGIVAVTPPGGTPIPLNSGAGVVGQYQAQLPANSVPANGGTFVVAGGTTGTNAVGPFNVNITFPNPIISWTNQQASATVTRSAGQTYTWTGGAANSYVVIIGTSNGNGVTGSYFCVAPQSAGTFTVPSYIIGSLPAGMGTSLLENATPWTPFSAAGLDFGIAQGFVLYQISTVYK